MLPFVGVPLTMQRDLRAVAWTALATVDHPVGRGPALVDLRATVHAVAVLVPEGRAAAAEATAALASADDILADDLRKRCAAAVEFFDALVARVTLSRLLAVMREALRR